MIFSLTKTKRFTPEIAGCMDSPVSFDIRVMTAAEAYDLVNSSLEDRSDLSLFRGNVVGVHGAEDENGPVTDAVAFSELPGTFPYVREVAMEVLRQAGLLKN